MIHFQFRHLLSNPTYIARFVCSVCVIATVAVAVHFGLKVSYGIPAPLPTALAAPMAAKPAPLWLASSPNTDLASQWRLLGVVAQGLQGQTHQGLALLQDTQQNRARAYRVGQQLPGGATLVAVETKTATLAFQGGQQTLNLETSETSTTPVAINTQRGHTGNIPMPTAINPAQAAAHGLIAPEKISSSLAGRFKAHPSLVGKPGATPAPTTPPAAKPQQVTAPVDTESEDD